MSAGYTPGPWRWSTAYRTSHDEDTYSLLGADGFGILSCDGNGNSPQGNGLVGEADARLIAAAPDLLEALLACRVYAGRYESAHMDNGALDACCLADAAIAKATGASSYLGVM